MADLLQRLKDYLAAPSTLDLAEAAPLGVLAGASAATIAAIIGMPAFATTGLGAILGGLAVNFTSSLIDKILTAAGERERRKLIQQGLEGHDRDVQTLVAGAMVFAGPEVATAIPDTDRAELVAALEGAMRKAGGTLAAIAAPYGAALRDPAADWGAVQAALRQEAATLRQIAEVGAEGRIENFRQRSENTEGSVDQILRAGRGGVISGGSQEAIGTHKSAPPAPVTPPVAPPEHTPDPPPAALHVRLRCAPTDTGAVLTWESDAFGVATSTFVSPYQGPDLDLVLRALDALQYPSESFTPEEIARFTALKLLHTNGILAEESHRSVGQSLYRALTADPRAAVALATARNLATHEGRPLSLAIHVPQGAIALAALPWELLWAAGEPAPLLLSRGLAGSLTRQLDLSQAVPPPRPGGRPLRVRAIVPHAGLEESQRAEERASREAAWARLVAGGAVALLPDISPATRETIADALRHDGPPDILHFIGHGRFSGGEGHLVLDRAGGGWDPTPISQLGPALSRVRLAVIAACQGAMVGTAETSAGVLGGVAPALIAQGVPLVVAMQLTVRQSAANRATGVIYEDLAAGRSLQAAVAAARLALYTGEDSGASWYVPTLYMRARGEGPAQLIEQRAD
ncbi:MAG: CHAT domain-containing protein [Chloroflexales bacterium]|nr:CHAT domain-containing protein [Chloroflexales bacterium]